MYSRLRFAMKIFLEFP